MNESSLSTTVLKKAIHIDESEIAKITNQRDLYSLYDALHTVGQVVDGFLNRHTDDEPSDAWSLLDNMSTSIFWQLQAIAEQAKAIPAIGHDEERHRSLTLISYEVLCGSTAVEIAAVATSLAAKRH